MFTITNLKHKLTQDITVMLWGIVLATVCCLFVLIYQSRFWGVQWDAAYFYYIARMISEGAVPYRDIFDINLPGTYAIYLFIITFLGEGDIYWRIADLFCLGVISTLIWFYCRPFGRLAGSIGVVLFASLHLYNGPMYVGKRDYFILMFILGGIYCIVRHIERCRGRVFLAFGGLLLGYACLIKPQAGFLCLLMLLILIAQAFRCGRGWLWESVFFTAFCCFLPAITMLILWYVGGLNPFIDILLNISREYSAFVLQPFNNGILFGFMGMPLLEIVAVAFASIVCSVLVPENRLRRLFIVLGMFYGFIHFYSQTHFIYQLYPFVLFLFMSIASWVGYIRLRFSGLIKCILLIVVAQLLLVFLYRSIHSIIEPPPHHIHAVQVKNMLVDDLSGKILPGETVQVMDTLGGGIHALYDLRCKQPTRFVFDAFLFHPSATSYRKKIRADFLGDLQDRPPQFFVLFRAGRPIKSFEHIEKFPELRDWLYSNYSKEIENEYYHLYRRK